MTNLLEPREVGLKDPVARDGLDEKMDLFSSLLDGKGWLLSEFIVGVCTSGLNFDKGQCCCLTRE